MADNKTLSAKQKRFCDEYLIDQNATQAAIRAGYSERTAGEQATRLLGKVIIKEYLGKLVDDLHNDHIMTAEEILKFFSDVATGKMEDTAVTPTGKVVEYKTTMKDRLRAAENLAKCRGMYDNRVKVEGQIPVVIVDDLEKAD